MQQETVSSSTIETDLPKIEAGLRQLKIQYDMFFNGALDREPIELRAELDALIRRHRNASIRNYAHRFHLNTLLSRFNSLSELWGKTLRGREEGDRPNARLADRRAAALAQERLIGVYRVRDVDAGDHELRRLHEAYSAARRRSDPTARPVRFEAFVQGVGRESARLRERSGCTGVELRVVQTQDGVHLKARPARS